MVEENVLAILKSHTEAVDQFLQHNGVVNDYGRQALEWLEGYVARRHDQMTQDERNRLIEMIGAFLGECLIRANGGEWIGFVYEGRKQLAVSLDKDFEFKAMPFNKVAKYFDDPSGGDSFASLFAVTPAMLKMQRDKHAARKSDDRPDS